jgi:hypothetical protein
VFSSQNAALVRNKVAYAVGRGRIRHPTATRQGRGDKKKKPTLTDPAKGKNTQQNGKSPAKPSQEKSKSQRFIKCKGKRWHPLRLFWLLMRETPQLL